MVTRHLEHLDGSSSVASSLFPDGSTALVGGVQLDVPAWRHGLYAEMHARPFPVLSSPVRVSHMAVLPAEGAVVGAQDLAHLASLCERFSLPPPAATETCCYREFSDFELRWEKHTEFCTWTVIRRGGDSASFADMPLTALPADWLAALPGRIVTAVHLAVAHRVQPMPTRDELRTHFEGHRMIGSRTYDGRAEVWTAFRLHADGFGRFLVFHDDLNPCETGRLVQQILELETYRLMALLSLPLVRESQQALSAMDMDLAAVVTRLNGNEKERVLLDQLAGHAARLEQLRAHLNYRLAATRAYYALAMTRLEQLRIGEMQGLQTMAYFLNRRLTPAVRTCEAMGARLDDLSQRIERAAELLRTRVELSIQEQNQTLLASMNRRSHMQWRLQQAVEGLSVAAISYYVVQLVHAVADGMPHFGIDVHPGVVTAISVPVVFTGVVALVVLLRRRVDRVDEAVKK